MAALNCPRCKKLFHKVLSPVCPACEKKEEIQFEDLRKYIWDNPTASISQVAEETEVPAKRILRYIREGRLIVPESMADIRCTSCGVQILEGNFCDPCAKKMADNLAGAFSSPPPPSAASTPANPGTAKSSPASAKKGGGMHTRK